MFTRCVHTEDDPIRAAAETVAARRRRVVTVTPDLNAASKPVEELPVVPALTIAPYRIDAVRPTPRPGPTKTAMGKYRPYRGRRDETRSPPPKAPDRAERAKEVQNV